jgi:hypothetical protein
MEDSMFSPTKVKINICFSPLVIITWYDDANDPKLDGYFIQKGESVINVAPYTMGPYALHNMTIEEFRKVNGEFIKLNPKFIDNQFAWLRFQMGSEASEPEVLRLNIPSPLRLVRFSPSSQSERRKAA